MFHNYRGPPWNFKQNLFFSRSYQIRLKQVLEVIITKRTQFFRFLILSSIIFRWYTFFEVKCSMNCEFNFFRNNWFQSLVFYFMVYIVIVIGCDGHLLESFAKENS